MRYKIISSKFGKGIIEVKEGKIKMKEDKFYSIRRKRRREKRREEEKEENKSESIEEKGRDSV